LTGQRFTVQRTVDGWSLPELHIPLLGRHQLANATAAVALTQELAGQGDVPVSAVRAGLAATRWPGRFEILQQHPAVVLDCAHNADSAVKLRATLDEVFPGHGRLALVFGASSDKDITGMFEVFLALGSANGFNPVDKIITTRSEHPRAADPAHLAGVAQSLSPACPTSIHQDTGSALDEALAWARPDDVICVTGSVFVVASARHVWSRSQPGTFSPDDWVSFDEDA
jgi:dihydrofolate synthase/folylpolyglutamate synthase